MKNKKRILGMFIVLIVSIIVVLVLTRNTFEKDLPMNIQTVNYKVIKDNKPNTTTQSFQLHENKNDTIKFLDIADYKISRVIDPPYYISKENNEVINEDDDLKLNATLHIAMNVLSNTHINFSTVEYEEAGIKKKANIGFYDFTTKDVEIVSEKAGHMNNKNRFEFELVIDTNYYGELVKAELVNDFLQADIDIKKHESNLNRVSVDISFKPWEGYDNVVTNMKYTFEKDGKRKVYYGYHELHMNAKYGFDYSFSYS